MSITLHSPAKINLALDILCCDASGYHEIDTVYYELKTFYDVITISKRNDASIIITCDNPDVPLDHTNTAYKSALLLGVRGVTIAIKKNIPVWSGLGGGSSNAAAVLNGLNQLFQLGHSRDRLMRLAAQIGMDTVFFFYGGCARGRHFGEKIEPLPYVELPIEVIDTGIKISSHEAYNGIDISYCGKNREKTQKLIYAVRHGDTDGIIENAHNDFESFVFEKYPELLVKKKNLQKNIDVRKVMLAGSGGALIFFKIPVSLPLLSSA